MKYDTYNGFVSADTLMGPNCIRILEELMNRYPVTLTSNDTVLDLGCGTGLTSLVLAKETGAGVVAVDLWINAEENAKRFADWGVAANIWPVHEDANSLSFEKRTFSAMYSVDSYHYYGGSSGFFEEKILPFMKEGSTVLIGIPGIKNAYSGRSDELLTDWLGDEAYMFLSSDSWKEIIGDNPGIEAVETWEMDCFDAAWNDWLSSKHEFANGDMQYFDRIIRPYTCLVGIYIKLK